ncbi:MAG TPA: rhodanese-like domain-containing protein [Fimbriimonas sp.]|nr:rhodanese-like domain-containing protein [Fimbriimonas sp.]
MNKTISIQDLHDRLAAGEKIQLVDVRSPGEYAAGHVPQAINIPLEQVEARLGDLHGGQVAVLCQSGTRAGMACNILKSSHDGLLLVEGGTKAWIAGGFPVVRSSANTWSLERQVRLVAGLLVLIGTTLAVTVNLSWIGLAMFVGAGLTFAGLTDVCGMAHLLKLMPWKKAASCVTMTAGDQR